MKMRVSIARALADRPKLLLLDEPFAALDEITRWQLNDALLNLRRESGATVVFVTHRGVRKRLSRRSRRGDAGASRSDRRGAPPQP